MNYRYTDFGVKNTPLANKVSIDAQKNQEQEQIMERFRNMVRPIRRVTQQITR